MAPPEPAPVEDLGFIVARAFAEPENFIGKELRLTSDAQSIDECRAIYREVFGKSPSRFPMPVWMFERFGFIGKDLSMMWRWLRTNPIDADTGTVFAIHPEALSIREWLENQKR